MFDVFQDSYTASHSRVEIGLRLIIENIKVLDLKMLSNRFYKLMGYMGPIFCFLGIFKYTWDSKSRLFVRPTGALFQINKNNTLINQVGVVTWICFHVAQAIRFYKAGNYNDFIFVLICTIMLLIGIVTLSLSTVWGEDGFSLVNSLFIFLRNANRKSLTNP